MSTEYFFPFIFSTGSSPFLNFQLLMYLLLFVSVFSLFLSPGGLAWALYKSRVRTHIRTAIPGPSGLPFVGLVLVFTSSLTHRVLAKMSESLKAKSLMAFSVGFTRFVISSELDTAKEILNSSLSLSLNFNLRLQMSTEYFFPFIFSTGSSPFLNFQLLMYLLLFVSVFSLFLSPGGLAWALYKSRVRTHIRTAIPGPSGLPLTHRVLAKMSESLKAKSLMAFSVGFTRFVISSEPDTAKEILNSSAFADRPIKESAYELLFHKAMGFAPFGEYWRNLRRISATHLFSPKRITHFGKFRQNIGLKMVEEIRGFIEREGGVVQLRKMLHFGSLNNVMMSVFGKSYDYGVDGGGFELESLVSEGYELLGIFNWSDHFPVLSWLDLQGVRKRCRNLVDKVNTFVGKIIEEHRLKRAINDRVDDEADFVDVLLQLEEDNKLSDSDMIAVLWEMIFRGTDTVAILLEWILARMVLHPEIQAKAQFEIDSVVGTSGFVSDSDLPNLPYLHAIVKETLRMHPPGPLLSWARLAIHDTNIGDHFIPAGSTAMVNMWSITHDERMWPQPNEFKPERFVEEDVSIMGSNLKLAPFGSGRRVCPGKAMGLATVELWLAQLLQSFKWVPSDVAAVDLSECLKLSLEMKNSLICKALPRASG